MVAIGRFKPLLISLSLFPFSPLPSCFTAARINYCSIILYGSSSVLHRAHSKSCTEQAITVIHLTEQTMMAETVGPPRADSTGNESVIYTKDLRLNAVCWMDCPPRKAFHLDKHHKDSAAWSIMRQQFWLQEEQLQHRALRINLGLLYFQCTKVSTRKKKKDG